MIGDCLNIGQYNHNGQPFSTKDRDNDESTDNCAYAGLGAWWYRNCHRANLNGNYRNVGPGDATGLSWFLWKRSHYSMKRASMKIRPN